MFSVEVYSNIIQGVDITRYLVFKTYTSATNCIHTLKGKERGVYHPEEYFEAATISREPVGELLGEPIETDWVLSYLEEN